MSEPCDKCKNFISGVCKACGRNATFIESMELSVKVDVHSDKMMTLWEQIASGEHPDFGKFTVGREAVSGSSIWVFKRRREGVA